MYFRIAVACLVAAGCSGRAADTPLAKDGIRGSAAAASAAVARAAGRARELSRDQKPEAAKQPAVTRPEAGPLAPDACKALFQRVMSEPALPGAPKLDHVRAEMLARAKGEPVLFARAPQWEKSSSPIVRGYRRALEKSRFPWETLRQIRDRFQYAPKVGRQVLLRDGYLYADSADLGWALWDAVRLEHLFDEKELVIHRGSERLRVVKGPEGRYVNADGLEAGKPARLLLFDRVSVAGQEPRAPLHRDVRALAHELGFERMKVLRQTERHLLAELRYEGLWSRAVLRAQGERLHLECEAPLGGDTEAFQAARRTADARARVLSALRSAMLEQVAEELPFDEPKTEWGQQDGHLLSHWEKAYSSGVASFFFQGDRYSVFSANGHPTPPQVCIDFVTETLERASGTWWKPKGSPPGRTRGGIDFDALLEKSRRQVTAFIGYTKSHPEQFEYELLPSRKRLPYVFKREFYRHLAREADRYAPGTIVIIRGYAPWDHYNVPHYHSFFVYESDPITGMPLLLAGNAGKPRIQSWEPIMSRAPQRSINYRIRPRLEWLADAITGEPVSPRKAPPLMAMF